jgi:hypothetical protein
MLIDIGDTCAFGAVTLGQTDSFGTEIYFTGLDGWGVPQSTVSATQRAAADGGFASPAYLQSRVFTVTCALVAPNRPTLVASLDALQSAASINTQHVVVTLGGQARYALAQRQGEVLVKDTSTLSAEVTVQFLAVDPRKHGADLTISTGLPSSTGGWTFPFTFPLTIASTVVSGTCALNNPGNAIGKVIARIDGPCTGPIVTHSGSGLALVFASSYQLAAGAFLLIDMDARTVLENGQSERIGWVTSRGYSGFDPGQNVWAFTSQTYNPSALLTITATPAWQ